MYSSNSSSISYLTPAPSFGGTIGYSDSMHIYAIHDIRSVHGRHGVDDVHVPLHILLLSLPRILHV